jgi:hypothetical protein
MQSHSLWRGALASAAVVTIACGPTVAAATAFDTAHDVEGRAEVAHSDYASCTVSDAGVECERVDKDLCAIIKAANALEGTAMDAGFTPATAPPGTPSFCK